MGDYSNLTDGHPVFVNLDRLPWRVPTRSDIEDDYGKRDKIGMDFKGLRFRIYNVHNKEERDQYEKDKVNVANLARLGRAQMIRESHMPLLNKGTQQLHLIMEWVEADFYLYEEGADGLPVRVEDITAPDKPKKPKAPEPVEVIEFVQDDDSPFLGAN